MHTVTNKGADADVLQEINQDPSSQKCSFLTIADECVSQMCVYEGPFSRPNLQDSRWSFCRAVTHEMEGLPGF